MKYKLENTKPFGVKGSFRTGLKRFVPLAAGERAASCWPSPPC